jgi:7-cyano-7-deazaguanine synthase
VSENDQSNAPRRAIILLSGGLDSATVLAMAQAQGFECHCLSFDYGQRHLTEIEFAARLAQRSQAVHRVIKVDLAWFGGSALTDTDIDVPTSIASAEIAPSPAIAESAADAPATDIPVTYVPARNTVFLSYALAYAEVQSALDIFIGVNAVDYSGYPDCRPEFIQAFETMANLATRIGVEGAKLTVHTPLIDLSKQQIIAAGMALGVDYAQTVSCYQLDVNGAACGVCDSCHLRRIGFEQAGVADPTLYQTS